MDKALFKKVCQVILVGARKSKIFFIDRRGIVMRMILSVIIGLLIVLSSPAAIHCQGDTLVDNIKTLDGNVASVDVQNSQITVKSSEVFTFFVPSNAKIINADGFEIRLSDVNAGNYVTVDYFNDKSGAHIMKGMEVEYNS